MKNLMAALLLTLLIAGNAFGQEGKLNKDVSKLAKAPLYVIEWANGKQLTSRGPELSLIAQTHIDKLEIFTGDEAIKRAGRKAKNGLVIVKVKEEAEILNLTALLEKYSIPSKNRRLPLYIDSNLVVNARNSFYSNTKIKSITIATESETGKKYISIITSNVKLKLDPNATYIRGLPTAAIKK
jgi:hypothetical protein